MKRLCFSLGQYITIFEKNDFLTGDTMYFSIKESKGENMKKRYRLYLTLFPLLSPVFWVVADTNERGILLEIPVQYDEMAVVSEEYERNSAVQVTNEQELRVAVLNSAKATYIC